MWEVKLPSVQIRRAEAALLGAHRQRQGPVRVVPQDIQQAGPFQGKLYWGHASLAIVSTLTMLQIHKKNCYLAAPAEFVVDGLVSDYDYGSGGGDGGGGNAAQNTQAGDAGGFQ